MNFMRREQVEAIRRAYPVGTRLVVDYMDDPWAVLPGVAGSVERVDDIGTIHCRFDNGRRLGLIPGVDGFHRE